MKPHILIFTLSLLSATVRVAGQEVLDLTRCREMALQYNKEIASSAKQTESARYMVKSYKGLFFPNLSLNGTGLPSEGRIYKSVVYVYSSFVCIRKCNLSQ